MDENLEKLFSTDDFSSGPHAYENVLNIIGHLGNKIWNHNKVAPRVPNFKRANNTKLACVWKKNDCHHFWELLATF